MEARRGHRASAKGRRHHGQSGIAAVELAILLPFLLILVFGIIDFGRLIQARLVLTNVSREGANLYSRDLESDPDVLIELLKKSALPLDIENQGKIYVWKIDAGTTSTRWWPTVDRSRSESAGALSVGSSISYYRFSSTDRLSDGSLSSDVYNYLKFDTSLGVAPIGSIVVVEVFYKYEPITPLSNFITGLLTDSEGGKVLGSRAVF